MLKKKRKVEILSHDMSMDRQFRNNYHNIYVIINMLIGMKIVLRMKNENGEMSSENEFILLLVDVPDVHAPLSVKHLQNICKELYRWLRY